MTVAIILIVLAVLCRVLPTLDLSLSNLSPFTAIAFCGAVYVRKPWFWALSFLARLRQLFPRTRIRIHVAVEWFRRTVGLFWAGTFYRPPRRPRKVMAQPFERRFGQRHYLLSDNEHAVMGL